MHPEILSEFEKGNFSVQLRSEKPFCRQEADKTIEVTINKYTKTPGGITGFSINHDAVHRWTLDIIPCFRLKKNSSNSNHRDVTVIFNHPERDCTDIEVVNELLNTTFINPFKKSEHVRLPSGIKAGQKVTDDLLCANEICEIEMKRFIEEKLVNAPFSTAVKEPKTWNILFFI